MFFKRQPKESPDDLANRLQQEGKIDQLEKELERYNPTKLSKKDKESYYHLWGIAAFQRDDRQTAFQRFKEGQERCPASVAIRFSLGQEHEARGEIDKMFACFDGCSFPAASSQYMLMAARYAYLWGNPQKGIEYLRPIADAYFELRIADDHYVYVRGLPFFSQTWSYLVTFAWMNNSYQYTDDLLNRAKSALSDYDFDSLELFYRANRESDFSTYIRTLTTSLENQDERFPSGYQRVQLAALNIANNNDPAAGIADLEGVMLAENDFPWLSDILLVHTARAYWKSEQADLHKQKREKFLARQTMLFEPDHAYNFAFIDYQEELRPIYQATRSQ